jgi:FtsZ-binding cell division protein ZapB
MEKDIKARMHKIRALLESLGEKEIVTQQEVETINQIIEELNQEIEDIKDIQKTYEDDDRELIGTMKSAK